MKRTIRTGSRLPRICAIFFLALITLSCATAGHKDLKVKKALTQSVDMFNSDIRWQDYDAARTFIPKIQEDRYWAEIDRMKHDIRLTEYEVRDIVFSENCLIAWVTVHYQYWSLQSPILRNATVKQTWRFEEPKNAWKVTDTGFRAITVNSSSSSGF
jgi:hypothetical protein